MRVGEVGEERGGRRGVYVSQCVRDEMDTFENPKGKKIGEGRCHIPEEVAAGSHSMLWSLNLWQSPVNSQL